MSTEKEFYTTEPEAIGGAVVFSYVVNAVKLNENRNINWLHQRILTLYFRWNINRLIGNIIFRCNKEKGTHFASYTIKRQRGLYVAPDGKHYSEPSIRLELLGSTVEELQTLGRMILDKFHQKSVMIVDETNSTKFHVRRAVLE